MAHSCAAAHLDLHPTFRTRSASAGGHGVVQQVPTKLPDHDLFAVVMHPASKRVPNRNTRDANSLDSSH
jgi:hypothetical protein